jgi:hypothetical protein
VRRLETYTTQTILTVAHPFRWITEFHLLFCRLNLPMILWYRVIYPRRIRVWQDMHPRQATRVGSIPVERHLHSRKPMGLRWEGHKSGIPMRNPLYIKMHTVRTQTARIPTVRTLTVRAPIARIVCPILVGRITVVGVVPVIRSIRQVVLGVILGHRLMERNPVRRVVVAVGIVSEVDTR